MIDLSLYPDDMIHCSGCGNQFKTICTECEECADCCNCKEPVITTINDFLEGESYEDGRIYKETHRGYASLDQQAQAYGKH